MIKLIFKLIRFLFTLFVAFIIFVCVFSIKSNTSFESTIAYFKSLGSVILNIDDSENIPANTDISDAQKTTLSNKHYYYKQLDSNGKIIYLALENNIDNLKKENYVIDFSGTFNDLLHESLGQYKLNKAFQSALDAFFYDHPELFYIDLTKISLVMNRISLGSAKAYSVQIAPKDNKNYLYSNFDSEIEVNLAIKKVENIKNSIVNQVKNDDTYDKILTIHNMLVNSLEYNGNHSNSYNIYGALVEKQVVCEGYAKAFKYLLDSLEIECILVTGSSINASNESETHMWNYVKLNDNWYGVDVTWDDPIVIGGLSSNILRHSYFLKGSNAFVNSHVPSGKISDTGMVFSIPILSSKNYKY